MEQQTVTFESMFSHVKDDGVYLCEDLATSYSAAFGGMEKALPESAGPPGSMVDLTKQASGGEIGAYRRCLLAMWSDGVSVIWRRSIAVDRLDQRLLLRWQNAGPLALRPPI